MNDNEIVAGEFIFILFFFFFFYSYDRNLGGTDITIKLRDYLAKKFNDLGKTKTDVTTVPRAMGKLLKEAGKVKTVLSANTNTYAQVENVMEDIDMR